jgi:hypothetical protein
MWRCLKCGEEVEDHFDLCWNCQANRRGLRQFKKIVEEDPVDERVRARVNKKHKPIKCVRCSAMLTYTGSRRLQQGPGFGVFGDLGESEVVEMYVCGECNHVEFFAFGE